MHDSEKKNTHHFPTESTQHTETDTPPHSKISLQLVRDIQQFLSFCTEHNLDWTHFIYDVLIMSISSKTALSTEVAELWANETASKQYSADVEKIQLKYFNQWLEEYEANTSTPLVRVHTVQQLKTLLRDVPNLNQHSPVNHQGTVFVHISTDPHRSNSSVSDRLYINPQVHKTPQFFDAVLQRCSKEGVLLSGKFVDYSQRKSTDRPSTRGENLVLYCTAQNCQQVLRIATDIANENPEWFENRKVPPLVGEVQAGIGHAEQPSLYTKMKSSLDSFNPSGITYHTVRTGLIKEALVEITRTILTGSLDFTLPSGKTVHTVLNEIYEPLRKKRPSLEASTLPDAVKNGFRTHFCQKQILPYFVPLLLPLVDSKKLLPLLQAQIDEMAPKLGVDPRHIEKNLHSQQKIVHEHGSDMWRLSGENSSVRMTSQYAYFIQDGQKSWLLIPDRNNVFQISGQKVQEHSIVSDVLCAQTLTVGRPLSLPGSSIRTNALRSIAVWNQSGSKSVSDPRFFPDIEKVESVLLKVQLRNLKKLLTLK